jgi:hypothetical protein
MTGQGQLVRTLQILRLRTVCCTNSVKSRVPHPRRGRRIGHVDDFLLTTTGRFVIWSSTDAALGKRVLVSPQVVSGLDPEKERIEVSMTKDQIEHSKSIETADIALDEVLPTIWVM